MWIWIGGGVLIIAVLLFAVMMTQIRLTLNIVKKNKDDTIIVEAKALAGMIKYQYEIPSIIFKDMQEGVVVEEKAQDNFIKRHHSEEKQNIDKAQVEDWRDKFRRILQATKDIKMWLFQTLRHVKVTHLDWTTEICLDAADQTAILAGSLWALKCSLIGGLSYLLQMETAPKLHIIPLFGLKPQISTKMTCIAQIRCGYAMYAGLVLIVRVLKVKGGIKKWQSILFKG
ncbi:hypothetical protein J2Z69_000517 [Paenibacillus shirakamiensis]|uniref:DUF2953 domain-containing protein n=1 Tax=Paenibacillus shirakamiensis TaxID=1265935 RepID=A0ABS4JCS3_9BACL|nr:DUF2953 domain-containing protein [Paenibacillus shirakamiensis]MBP1999498.1 hypothetical protein [Paenibacillus shirakamiensis]